MPANVAGNVSHPCRKQWQRNNKNTWLEKKHLQVTGSEPEIAARLSLERVDYQLILAVAS